MMSLNRKGSMGFGTSAEKLALGRFAEERGENTDRPMKMCIKDVECAVKVEHEVQLLRCALQMCLSPTLQHGKGSTTNLSGLPGPHSNTSMIRTVIGTLQGAVEISHCGCRFCWYFYYPYLEEWLCRLLRLCPPLWAIPSLWSLSG